MYVQILILPSKHFFFLTVGMYVCIHACMYVSYTHIYTHTHTRIDTYIHTCTGASSVTDCQCVGDFYFISKPTNTATSAGDVNSTSLSSTENSTNSDSDSSNVLKSNASATVANISKCDLCPCCCGCSQEYVLPDLSTLNMSAVVKNSGSDLTDCELYETHFTNYTGVNQWNVSTSEVCYRPTPTEVNKCFPCPENSHKIKGEGVSSCVCNQDFVKV
jgi:hypothetical protein